MAWARNTPFDRAGARPVFALLLLGVLLRLLVWGIGARILPPSSDESIAMLMASDLLDGQFHLHFLAQPYLFPLGAYLLAPLSLLPPGAWVYRLLPLALGLAMTALALRLLPRKASRAALGMGALLTILPSCYLLMLQGFYAPPGYSILLLECVLLPMLVRWSRETGQVRWAFAIGVLASLGFAAHSLALCASLPALVVLLTPAKNSPYRKNLLAASAGVLLGALPYGIAKIAIPGVHAVATDARPMQEILARVWSPALTHTLPGTLGFRAVPFCDTEASGFLLPITNHIFAASIATLLLLFVGWRLVVHLRAVARKEWPCGQTSDLLLGTVLLNLILFAAAPRADSGSFRYLAPAALSFALLLAQAVCHAPKGLRHLAWAGALILLIAQIPTGWRMARDWQTPGFAERMGLPDLQPALQKLKELEIHHAVASYGAAYRITYSSGGSILAAQPFNERFPGWPIPYKADVDAASDVAYVLTDAIRFLKPAVFERHLRTMGLTASVVTAGSFRIYHDFKTPGTPPLVQLDPALLEVTVPTTNLAPTLIHDGQTRPPWRTHRAQQAGDRIELQWPGERPLAAIVLVYENDRDTAKTMRLSLRSEGEWQVHPEPFSGPSDKFDRREGRPIYGRSVKRIPLQGQQADGARLEITEPNGGRDWTVAEIEVYEEQANPD